MNLQKKADPYWCEFEILLAFSDKASIREVSPSAWRSVPFSVSSTRQ